MQVNFAFPLHWAVLIYSYPVSRAGLEAEAPSGSPLLIGAVQAIITVPGFKDERERICNHILPRLHIVVIHPPLIEHIVDVLLTQDSQ